MLNLLFGGKISRTIIVVMVVALAGALIAAWLYKARCARLEEENAALVYVNDVNQKTIITLNKIMVAKDVTVANVLIERERNLELRENVKVEVKNIVKSNPVVKDWSNQRVPDDIVRLLVKQSGNSDRSSNSTPTGGIAKDTPSPDPYN